MKRKALTVIVRVLISAAGAALFFAAWWGLWVIQPLLNVPM